MLLENLTKFIKYYGKGRKLKLAGFGMLSFIAGCLEFIGVALIYPFIIMIIQPDNVNITKYIKLENSLTNGLLIGLIVLLIFIFKNLFIILTQFIQNKFVNNWRQYIVSRYIEYYIYAPYKETMKSAPTDKYYVMGTLASTVIDGFVLRILNLTTNAVIIFMVIMLLLIKFTLPAIVTCFFVGLAVLVQNKYFKKRTSEIAQYLAQETKDYTSILLDTTYNIREIKIASAENIFYNNFKAKSDIIKSIQSRYGFYSAIPPYIVEILIVTALIFMAYILSIQTHGNNTELIASFAIFVAALFRIAPALNRIQTSAIAINTTRNMVKMLNEEYENCNLDQKLYKKTQRNKMQFKDKIRIENITFSYNTNKQTIKNISLEIKKGDFIGIIGISGSGKSTLADIITGLLPVDSGKIFVDNTELTEKNFKDFRKLVGYIPQQISVLDKSIKENVAFGCNEIDDKRVIQALKAARLYDVIMENPDGIDSQMIIGSNGLSYGQKQRLAIARALYRDPEIIILDEATSSLDVQVEKEITEMLTKIGTTKTIIAIAHRLSTLKACNKLVYMKDGKIVDIGGFEELAQKYEEFDNLVKLSNINS